MFHLSFFLTLPLQRLSLFPPWPGETSTAGRREEAEEGDGRGAVEDGPEKGDLNDADLSSLLNLSCQELDERIGTTLCLYNKCDAAASSGLALLKSEDSENGETARLGLDEKIYQTAHVLEKKHS